MKKLLVTLLCIGGLIGLPGCGGGCCRQTCEAPCDRNESYEEYYEDGGVRKTCYGGQEVVVYEGEKQPMTKKGKMEKPMTQKTYRPLHHEAVSGSEVRFLDKGVEEHITEPMPVASRSKRSYGKEMMEEA